MIERMCICCRVKSNKHILKRVAKNKNGIIQVDKTHKLEGRGAYICSLECLKKCIKTKQLNRAFKMQVSDEVYKELESAWQK
ncbi:MAG: YlxR family protein [Firmicutes bacterium]|nr:YlxR family protein [Bacillota bacterium]